MQHLRAFIIRQALNQRGRELRFSQHGFQERTVFGLLRVIEGGFHNAGHFGAKDLALDLRGFLAIADLAQNVNFAFGWSLGKQQPVELQFNGDGRDGYVDSVNCDDTLLST